jgi:hypothetical protein
MGREDESDLMSMSLPLSAPCVKVAKNLPTSSHNSSSFPPLHILNTTSSLRTILTLDPNNCINSLFLHLSSNHRYDGLSRHFRGLCDQ